MIGLATSSARVLFYPPHSPALIQAATAGSTPFSLNLHSGDVGHTLILEPTGAGKSIYPLCQALDDSVFYDLGQYANNINLCPLAQIDDPEVMSWAAEWLEMLIEIVAPGFVTPARRILLNDALKNLAASTTCAAERTLSEYITSVQDKDMKAALGFYSLNQSRGYLPDGDHDDINYASFNVFEIASLLEREKNCSCCPHLFIIPNSAEIGRRTVSSLVDEAWTAMHDKLFSDKIRGGGLKLSES